MFDSKQIKTAFPILKRQINGKSLVYLDNASTTQKPQSVIDAISNYYQEHNANIHRGIHTLSEEATDAYEQTRTHVARFINAESPNEIVFTRNTTEAINLIAYTFGETEIFPGDEIIVSQIEHHSNLVPWQYLRQKKQAQLKVILIKEDLTLDLVKYRELLSTKTKLVCITGMSNVLGTIPDLKTIIEEAHKVGAKVLVDGAQSAAHLPTDVQELDCDFFTLSAHKMLGPTGVGVLYGKKELLDKLPPFNYGGSMIKTVDQFESEFADTPAKFEAGTPNIADTIAFKKALEFLEEIGLKNIFEHDTQLLDYAIERFKKYPEVQLFNPRVSNSQIKAGGVLSFTVEGSHPHDIASIFNAEGVAIRSGHHCVEPLMKHLNIPATARMSFYLYNTEEDVERAEKALKEVIKIFK